MSMINIKIFINSILFVLCLMAFVVFPRQGERLDLGKLQTGATVSFVHTPESNWGIEISNHNSVYLGQEKPVQLEVFQNRDNVFELASGYQSVQREGKNILAKAKVTSGGKVLFNVEDKWSISGAVLSLSRKVDVTGTEDSAGFYSEIQLSTGSKIKWEDTKYLIPGLYYGESHTRASAPGGKLNYNAKQLSIREDYMSAPLFGVLFRDGNWVSVLDPVPDGSTTWKETTAPAAATIIDERILFGALGAHEVPGGGIEFGFRLPGTIHEFSGVFRGSGRGSDNATPVVRRRYNPVKAGFSQNYKVKFRFGKSESFRDMERIAWRWAWQVLNPKVIPINLNVVRRTLIDHLADRVLIVDNRAGVPFVIDAVSGKPGSFRPAVTAERYRMLDTVGGKTNQNHALFEWAKSIGIDIDTTAAELDIWPKIVIGFCGKNVEVAEQFLKESDRDHSARGERLKKLGLMIINSLVRIVPVSPPSGEGFDMRTGKPSAVHGGTAFTLRSWAEDMRAMIDLIRYERAHGRRHPAWFKWAKDYTDWLLTQQREDGSFPMEWMNETGAVKDGTTGVTSYSAVPLLVKMSEVTGDKKYLRSAIRAADYIWKNFGSKCVFLGATGTSNVADKESGMLSTEAFLALYEYTKENKWLNYARTAGDYTESWIWIWNVPMPVGANYAELGWKPGVPTIGVNGIGSDGAGGVDEYLDWAVPTFAKLFKYTNDEHYLNVARILLHDTKSMLALPGRTYDLKGPGWQQEHWHMGPIRGIGAHRTWLPWISVNHLNGITGLEEFDSTLYKQLSNGN
jgi:hypothetical protein